MFKNLLAEPSTRGIDIDDPRIPELRRRILRDKSFLRQIYEEWYAAISAVLPGGQGPVLELGSGPGFLKDFIPELITSELFGSPGVSVVLEGEHLPMADRVLRGIVMTNVLHHLCQPRRFLGEAVRCLRPGGVVVIIEPWVTLWSRLVYTKLHHEPFQPRATTWEFPHKGPLSGANAALPWIIFERDRAQFEREFPELQIKFIELCMPFRYLVSGGISLRSLMPGWSFGLWRRIENCLGPWMKTWAMFAQITLVRDDTPTRRL
jgi:SAM-dependent methyltransferase